MNPSRTLPFLILLLALRPIHAQKDLNALYFSGDYERLILETGAVLDRGDSALEVFSLKALAESQLGRTGDAIQTLEVSRAIHPEDVSLMRMLAGRYQEAGNMVRAREEYQQILALDSLDLSVWLQLARIASFRQDYPVAVYHLKKVLALDSVNLDGLMLMGESMERLPNTSCIPYYQRAYRHYPENQKAAFALANGYIQGKKPEQALPICRSVLEYDTTNIRFNKLLAYAYYRDGDPYAANIYFQDASRLGDSTFFTFKFMGLSRYLTTDFHGAAEALRIAATKDSLDAEIHFFLGSSLSNSTEKDAALYHLDRSLELSFPEPATLSRIYGEQGNILRLQENYQEAYEHYKLAWEADSTRPISLYYMASIQDNSLHQREQALSEYEYFIEVLDRQKTGEKKDKNQVLSVRTIVEQRIVDLKEELFFLDR